MPVVEKRRALEQMFRATNYQHPRGDLTIHNTNDAVWKETILPLLVNKETAKAITGGVDLFCRKSCLSEDQVRDSSSSEVRFSESSSSEDGNIISRDYKF